MKKAFVMGLTYDIFTTHDKILIGNVMSVMSVMGLYYIKINNNIVYSSSILFFILFLLYKNLNVPMTPMNPDFSQ